MVSDPPEDSGETDISEEDHGVAEEPPHLTEMQGDDLENPADSEDGDYVEQTETEELLSEPIKESVQGSDEESSTYYLYYEQENDFAVSVEYTKEANLPEGVQLSVKELLPGSEEYESYYQASFEILDEELGEHTIPEIEYARFFDISLLENTEDGLAETEPEAPVTVYLQVQDVPELTGDTSASIVHFQDEAAPEVLDTELVSSFLISKGNMDGADGLEEDTADTFAFVQDHFSISGLLLAGSSQVTLPVTETINDYAGYHAVPAGISGNTGDLLDLEDGKYVIYCGSSAVPYLLDGASGTFQPKEHSAEINTHYDTFTITEVLTEGFVWNVSGRVENGVKTYEIFNSSGYLNSAYGISGYSNHLQFEINKTNNGTGVQLFGDNSRFLRGSPNGSLISNQDSGTTFYLARLVRDISDDIATRVEYTDDLSGRYLFSRETTKYDVRVLNSELKLDRPVTVYDKEMVSQFGRNDIWLIEPVSGQDYAFTVRNEKTGDFIHYGNDTAVRITQSGNSYQIHSMDWQYCLHWRNRDEAIWDANSSYSTYIYKIKRYDVYFDPTSGGVSQYTQFNPFVWHNSLAHQVVYGNFNNEALVSIPSQDDVYSNGVNGYNYLLRGWYDIYGRTSNTGISSEKTINQTLINENTDVNGTYIPAVYQGQKVTVTGDTVLYADWDGFTPWNLDRNDVSPYVIDTHLFIKTDVFDYNALFNISSTLRDTESWTLNEDSHSEFWTMNKASGRRYIFVKSGQQGKLTDLNDRKWSDSGGPNQSNGVAITGPNCYRGVAWQQILTSGITEGVLESLFTPNSNELGRYYKGTDGWLYSYDPVSGYYYYDSTLNAATYDEYSQRFYVSNHTNSSSASSGNDRTDFLPFNYGTEGTVFAQENNVDYHFGMHSEISFYLPNDTGTGGNKAVNGNSMIYRFFGDDDVWVIVTDSSGNRYLLLDLGGIHGEVFGEIDFSQGTTKIAQRGASMITTSRAQDGTLSNIIDESHTSEEQIINDSFFLPAGNYKMDFYYVERGSSESNAAIYFNIAPSYELNFAKLDPEHAATAANDSYYDIPKWNNYADFIRKYNPLAGAEFKIYEDAALTQEIKLDVQDYTRIHEQFEDGKTTYTYTSDNGVFRFKNLIPNKEYYLKEIKSPVGYNQLNFVLKGVITNDRLIISNAETGEIVLTAAPVSVTLGDITYHYVDTWITNSPGYVLPETGGPGDWLFKGGGTVIVVLCGVLLWKRKRTEVMNQ